MKTVMKILAVLFLVIILAIAAFIYTFDANNYKPQLTDLAQKLTGRSLTINGNIDISIYPWIGLKVDKVIINNRHGFSQSQFASVEQFDIKIRIMPLLSKRLEIDELVINRLQLNLEKNAGGENNWSDFMGAQNRDAAGANYGLAGLLIDGVELVNSNIIWKDAATGKQFDINEMSLETEALVQGQALPVTLKTRIKSNLPSWQAAVAVKSSLLFSEQHLGFTAKDFNLAANAVFPSASIKKASFSVTADTDVNLDQHTASLKNARIKALGLLMSGDFDLTNIFSIPVISGPLKVEPFTAASLLKNFDIDLPELKNENSLKNISMTSFFQTNFDAVHFDKIQAQLDNSQITGFVHIDGGQKSHVRFELKADKIGLDDYLLSSKKNDAGSISLPLDFIRSVDLDGQLDVDTVTANANDIEMSSLHVISGIKDGILTVSPVNFKMAETVLNSSVQMDVRDRPVGSMQLKVQNIDAKTLINPWLNEMLGQDVIRLDGIASIDANLRLRGDNFKALKETAEGLVKLNMAETTLHGVDLDHASRSVVVDFANKNNFRTRESFVSEKNTEKAEVFDRLSGNFNLSYGKLTTSDLMLTSDTADIKLTGNTDLLKQVLGYKVSLDMHVKNPVDIRDKLRDHPMEYNARGVYGKVACDFDYTRYDHLVSRMLAIEAKARRIQQIKRKETTTW